MAQDEQRVTYAPKLTKDQGRIDWTREAASLHNHIRAMHPWPGAYFDWTAPCGKTGGKVLTLTGRLSIFRAKKVTDLKFIRLIEADCLDHWLWGRFRFLSGDDKSTWYALLKDRAEMLYVPDALCWTVDTISEEGMYQRMIQNLLRWSGNMLRNGARAIALGPRRVGFFIWWCIVDQRIAMWTSLAAPLAMISAGFIVSKSYWTSYVLWVMLTRLFLSCLIFEEFVF